MQPVVRGHTADADMPATQNFLPNKRDHDGVINIVVGGIASVSLRRAPSCLSPRDSEDIGV
jgi:hypothetical protein